MDELLSENERKPYEKELYIKDLYLLTVSQAALLFNIGERKIRGLVATHPKGEWYLMNGNKVMIKQKLFAAFIDKQTRI